MRWFIYMLRLCGRRCQVGDEVLALLLLLDTGENHLGTGDELLRVLKVHKEGGGVPVHTVDLTLVDVGCGVGESWSLPSLAAQKSVKVGTLLVGTSGLNSVALAALGLEDLGSLGNVSHCNYLDLVVQGVVR